MDLTKEIKEIKDGKVEDLILDLHKQKKDIFKKLHIAQVIRIGNYLDELYENKTLSKLNAVKVKAYYYYEPDVGNVINFDLLKIDESKVYISQDLQENLLNSLQKLNSIFFSLNEFSPSHVNEKFTEGARFIFPIEDGLGSKIIELLLSKELLSLVKYNEMQLDLNSSNNNSNKKFKA